MRRAIGDVLILQAGYDSSRVHVKLSRPLGAGPETAVRGSGGAVSASIRRRQTVGMNWPPRAAPHRRCDGAPAPAMHTAPDPAPAAPRGPWLRHLDAERLQPLDFEDGADEVSLGRAPSSRRGT